MPVGGGWHRNRIGLGFFSGRPWKSVGKDGTSSVCCECEVRLLFTAVHIPRYLNGGWLVFPFPWPRRRRRAMLEDKLFLPLWKQEWDSDASLNQSWADVSSNTQQNHFGKKTTGIFASGQILPGGNL